MQNEKSLRQIEMNGSSGQELQLAGVAGQLEAYLRVSLELMSHSVHLKDSVSKLEKRLIPMLRELQTADSSQVYVRYIDLALIEDLVVKMTDTIGDPALYFFDLLCETDKIVWQLSETQLPLETKETIGKCHKLVDTAVRSFYRTISRGYTDYNVGMANIA